MLETPLEAGSESSNWRRLWFITLRLRPFANWTTSTTHFGEVEDFEYGREGTDRVGLDQEWEQERQKDFVGRRFLADLSY